MQRMILIVLSHTSCLKRKVSSLMEMFFNEKISLMFKLVVLNIEKNACVKGETIHNHVGDVTPD